METHYSLFLLCLLGKMKKVKNKMCLQITENHTLYGFVLNITYLNSKYHSSNLFDSFIMKSEVSLMKRTLIECYLMLF